MKITRPVHFKEAKTSKNNPPYWKWFRPVGTLARCGDKRYKLIRWWPEGIDTVAKKVWEEISDREYKDLDYKYAQARIRNRFARGWWV